MSGADTAAEALDIFQSEAEMLTSSAPPLTDPDVLTIIQAALGRGNDRLAVALVDACLTSTGSRRTSSTGEGSPSTSTSTSNSTSSSSSNGSAAQWTWPRATLTTLQDSLVGLATAGQVSQAQRIVGLLAQGCGVARRGSEELPFGHVVCSPLDEGSPLTVVRPGDPPRVVACSSTRYEFELFPGTVQSVQSESLASRQSRLTAVLRVLGVWKAPPVGAIHEVVVRGAGSQVRAFRFATPTADVPASVGDSVTVVCAPSVPSRPLLDAAPPGTKPGEPLTIWNHDDARVAKGGSSGVIGGDRETRQDVLQNVDVSREGATAVQRPPYSLTTTGLPAWVGPLVLLLAASDGASWFVDPALPAMLAWGAGTVAVAAISTTSWVIPELKRLPTGRVRVEAVRQTLLAQHLQVRRALRSVVGQARLDTEGLARLSQLRDKMASVEEAEYASRQARVEEAADALAERLRRGVELVDGYARVLAMIEIEVEMDLEVERKDVAGIEAELGKLAEMAELQEKWQIQLDAQDEVERLIRRR